MNLDPQWVATVVAIAGGISFFLPMLQAFIQRPWWTPKVKAGLTVALAILGGFAGYITQHGLAFTNPASIVTWIVGVYSLTVVTYHGLLKPTGIAPGIEEATSPGPGLQAGTMTLGAGADPSHAQLEQPDDDEQLPGDDDKFEFDDEPEPAEARDSANGV